MIKENPQVKLNVEKDRRTIFVLASEYTDDGEHLNGYGRKIVAEQLLIYLANLLE